MFFSGSLSLSTVMSHCNGNPRLPSWCQASIGENTTNLLTCNFVPKWIPRSKIQACHIKYVQPSFAISRGGSHNDLKLDNEYHEEPFLLQLFKETYRSFKSLIAFLAEQPGQLKYIEWPSFKDTLRTATLTLVLVAMLILALSAVDSTLSFMLALVQRKPA